MDGMSQPGAWRRQDRIGDWLSLLAALCLFLAPWVLGFSASPAAAWNAWVSAVVVGVLAVIALTTSFEWEDWVEILAGVWVAVAPWVLGFSANLTATWAHVVLGVVIVAAAVAEVGWLRRHGPKAA